MSWIRKKKINGGETTFDATFPIRNRSFLLIHIFFFFTWNLENIKRDCGWVAWCHFSYSQKISNMGEAAFFMNINALGEKMSASVHPRYFQRNFRAVKKFSSRRKRFNLDWEKKKNFSRNFLFLSLFLSLPFPFYESRATRRGALWVHVCARSGSPRERQRQDDTLQEQIGYKQKEK